MRTIEFSSYLTRREQNQKNKCLVEASFLRKDFASLSLQGFPFLPHLPAGVQGSKEATSSACFISAYPIWGWMKPRVPQALLFYLLEVVNIERLSKSIYSITCPVNIYVACGWLGVLDERGLMSDMQK